MSYYKSLLALVCVVVLGLAAHPARAIPVTDAGAIAQLVTQIEYWKQQIQGMTDQLNQLTSTYAAMTGDRGMQNLLALTPQMRNYLPADWAQLADALQGLKVQSLVTASAVLTQEQLNLMAPEVREWVETERKSAALRQVTTRAGLENTSNHFQNIQQLINAISTAADQKAILDLQARIQGELSMLQNEQTKLQMLQQVSQAEALAQRQREWEHAVAGQGRFATRFQPQP